MFSFFLLFDDDDDVSFVLGREEKTMMKMRTMAGQNAGWILFLNL